MDLSIVLYRLSTSNHNLLRQCLSHNTIVLYRLSTSNHNPKPLILFTKTYCLISSFYIKPQLQACHPKPFLHCLISSFYIKPQLMIKVIYCQLNCLISSFYIKPQLITCQYLFCVIVLYRLSTSNHNGAVVAPVVNVIVLYRLSTSNHNVSTQDLTPASIVLYRLSTSNHNSSTPVCIALILSYIVFLHQTTTSLIYSSDSQSVLSYIKQ